MPKWGLTSAMREQCPYELDADLLRSAKIITDPVHGDIRLTDLERRIVDSPPFQRLRRVNQLGTTHLVCTRAPPTPAFPLPGRRSSRADAPRHRRQAARRAGR
jgi:hypothetical protein